MKTKVGILASGNGSNAKALILAAQEENALFEVSVVLSDKKNAKVLDRAQEMDIANYFVDPKGIRKVDFENNLIEKLNKHDVEWVCLAGFMRLISPHFINKYTDDKKTKILNIHPSLLPLHPGLDAYEKSFATNDEFYGATVHFVDEGMDTGEILLQGRLLKSESDTFTKYKEKGLKLEHKIYPKALNMALEKYRGLDEASKS